MDSMNRPCIDISRAEAIQGWMSRTELEWLAEQSANSNSIIEIGSYRGRSSVAMLANTIGDVLCIDTFTGSPGSAVEREAAASGGDDIYLEFVENTWDFENLIVLRCKSSTAARILTRMDYRVDFVFIDGNHSMENVVSDIRMFMPLIDRGGILSGHDADRDTVREALKRCGITYRVLDTLWFSNI